MNLFDKICASLAFAVGLILLGLGAVGLFLGSKASFELPPVLGFLPALVGWGIVRSVRRAWSKRIEPAATPPAA